MNREERICNIIVTEKEYKELLNQLIALNKSVDEISKEIRAFFETKRRYYTNDEITLEAYRRILKGEQPVIF